MGSANLDMRSLFLDYEKRVEEFDTQYSKETAQRRMSVLRSNPELDAMTVFFGRRTTVQTPVAIDFLRTWMERWDVPAEVLPPFGSLMP